MKLAIRSIHKYLSLFISLQLLLWTISGIYFAYNKIEMIRGEHLRTLQNKDVPINLAEFPTITGNSIMGIIRLDQVIFKINTRELISASIEKTFINKLFILSRST